jgi:pyruvate/2-oxoglutarate/acetoin dehydrogenase E1 component
MKKKKGREITYGEAIREALEQSLAKDSSVYVMGLCVDDPKGIFGTTLNLHEKFGRERVFDTPISENAMTGICTGSALASMRPVLVHARCDFMLYSMDQIVNHAAKWRYMSGGRLKVPITIRAIVGRGWGQGAQHSQSLQAFFAHVPGLKVVMPSNAYDAKGLLMACIEDDSPTIVIEYRWLYDHKGEVPENPYTLPLGKADIKRKGKDVTIVAISYMVYESLRAARVLYEDGIDVEIVDPRSLSPLDKDAIYNSVKKTGRLVVADTSWESCGVAAEITALVADRCFNELRAPVKRVCMPDVPMPTSCALERLVYPGPGDISMAVKEVVSGKSRETLLKEGQGRFLDNMPEKEFHGPF